MPYIIAAAVLLAGCAACLVGMGATRLHREREN